MTKHQLQTLNLSAKFAAGGILILGIITYVLVTIVSHQSVDFWGYIGFVWNTAVVEGAGFLLMWLTMYIVLPQERQ
jgi:hypothetical protein